jgi:ABC-type transport system involved in multi-copper enzyme maturation permease subunit
MAVYKRTYKAYTGALTPEWSRFLVLSRFSFATLFDSRLFTAFTVVCFVPFLIGFAFIYISHSLTAQLVLGVSARNPVPIDGTWFLMYLAVQCWLGFFLTAWCAPGLISQDLANNALPLYLSRPLSRPEYLLGKITVLATLLSCITWVPALVLFLLQAEMEGHGWGWSNIQIAGAIFVSAWLFIALISLVSMALSVWMKWRVSATAAMLAVFFVVSGFGVAINQVLRVRWGMLLNLPFDVMLIWIHMFGVQTRFRESGFLPVWEAWATIVMVCWLAVLLLDKRLRAKEVIRG